MTSRVPVPAARVSIAQLAKMKGVSRRTLHRTLMALWAKDGADGRGDWLYRIGWKWWVNLSRLKAAHPALFEQRYVDRMEFDGLLAKMANFEAKSRLLNQRINAVAANVRELRLGQNPGQARPRLANENSAL
jgi:hypothetical protein